MGRNGKYLYDSGRARCSYNKDRAQLEFDDMLIEEFLVPGSRRPRRERGAVPVRFGTSMLAEHLSDSAIASALVDDTRLITDIDNLGFSIGDFFDGQTFDQVLRNDPADADSAEPARAPVKVIATRIDRPTPFRAQAAFSEKAPKKSFTFKGLGQGFLVGAGVMTGALILLSLVI